MRYWYDEKHKCRLCEPNCAEEWLEMITDIGFDYDGYQNSISGLRSLVDEMVDCAKKGLECIAKNEVTKEDVAKETQRTYEETKPKMSKEEISEFLDSLINF